MGFDVTPDAYTRFMGQYSLPLALKFAALVDPQPGQRALDVGCGPGILTAELVERLGPERVAAVDPSESFLAATRAQLPGVDVRKGTAEDLPFDDDAFDLALAQLVVHFMSDPVRGLQQMARVTRPGGVVAACVWDMDGGNSPVSTFWSAVAEIDPTARDESGLPGVREGDLAALFTRAGLRDVEPGKLTVRRWFNTFEDWWEPYTLGVGPSGDYVSRLDDEQRAALAERCRARLPAEPFEVPGTVWCVRALA